MLFHCALKRPNYYGITQATSEPMLGLQACNGLIYPLPPPSPGPMAQWRPKHLLQKPTNGLIFLSQLLHKRLSLSAYWLKERREGKRKKEVREDQRNNEKKWRTIWSELQICMISYTQWPTEGPEGCAIVTFSLAQASDPWGLWGCCERSLIFFPASNWQWWTITLEEQPWCHVFCEALNIMKLFGSQFSRCPRSWDTHLSVSSHICQTRLVSNWFLQFPVPELYFWRANKNKDESPSPKSNDNSTHIYYRLSL